MLNYDPWSGMGSYRRASNNTAENLIWNDFSQKWVSEIVQRPDHASDRLTDERTNGMHGQNVRMSVFAYRRTVNTVFSVAPKEQHKIATCQSYWTITSDCQSLALNKIWWQKQRGQAMCGPFVRLCVCLFQSCCDINLYIYLRSCMLNKLSYDGRPPLYTACRPHRPLNAAISTLSSSSSSSQHSSSTAAAADGVDKLHNSRLPITVGNQP